MDILFVMLDCPPLTSGGFYNDLALELSDIGHNMTLIAPALNGQKTGLYIEEGVNVLRVRVPESHGVKSILHKGLALVSMTPLYKAAYRKYLKREHFDWILMPTPPINLVDFVSYVKRKTGAGFYLILRDIHPQSSRNILRVNPLIYKYLKCKSRKAYILADYIGCMSPANVEFVRSIAPYIDGEKALLLPNWIKFAPYSVPDPTIIERYGLEGKYIAIFGGTIGLGQAIGNIVELAKHYRNNENIVFLVVGYGIRKQMLMDMVAEAGLSNVRFLDYMPRNDYNELLKAADIGVISLDERYTVPTCPSKIIGYMANKIPVVAMINNDSDYGDYYIDRSGIGFWSANKDYVKTFADFDRLYNDAALRHTMGEAGYDYYKDNLTARYIAELLVKQITAN